MNFEEFKSIVENASEKHPVWFALEPDKIASMDDVVEAEKAMGVSFPKEYREFLMSYGGGHFGFSVVLSLDPESDFYLRKINEELKDDLGGARTHLVFSDNGCGDYYAFKIEGGKCSSSIEWYDHESGKWSETECQGLFEFLESKALTP